MRVTDIENSNWSLALPFAPISSARLGGDHRFVVRREEPGNRGSRRGIGRTCQRDVALAREQAGRRIETDPTRAGKVDFGPGVQIGDVFLGAAGTIERLHVGRELNQVAGNKARGQPKVPQ